MKPDYKGDLAVPRHLKPAKMVALKLLGDEAGLMQAIKETVAEKFRLLKLLCEHYSIEDGPEMFYELSLALAREIVPAFKPIPQPVGRKTKWTFKVRAQLAGEIELLIASDNSSKKVAWACGRLAKKEEWASFIEGKDEQPSSDPGEALRKQYYIFLEEVRKVNKITSRIKSGREK
jgi:hypothetical protein